ncbi:hypothetical protein PMIN06_010645 [Paraphaeosphaeria minitans]
MTTAASPYVTATNMLKQTNAEILDVLKIESEVLERVQNSFHTMIRARSRKGLAPIEITCFYEELPFPGVGVVVPAHSAILPGYIPIGIRSNHMDMTKFEGVDDPGFVFVAGELRRWTRELARPGIARAVKGTSGQGVSQGDGDTRGKEVLRIIQGGSEFHGSTTVSGGSLFQENYVGSGGKAMIIVYADERTPA